MPSVVKPKVLCFGYPTHCGQDYLDNFLSKFDLQTSEPGTREETKRNLVEKVAKDGPFDALIVPMGTPLYEPFDEDLLGCLAPNVKIVSSVSAGYNDFDVDWMTSQNIVFCNSRHAVCEPTADMAILMILAVLRNVKMMEKTMKAGEWRGKLGVYAPTDDPNGKVLGLIGLGAIGKHVARKAQVFHMDVRYYQRTRLLEAEEKELNVTYCPSMDELLACSDIVSPHFPLNKSTKGLIDRNHFAKMKDGVFFINTARGAIVDEDALIEAIESGKVARAGLDVHCIEPNHDTYFTRSDRCFVQPHMGGLTKEAWFKAFREAMDNIESFFATGKAISPINEREVLRRIGKS